MLPAHTKNDQVNLTLRPASSDCGSMTIQAEDDMDKNKQQRLENAGWKIGSAAEFLELSPEEAEYVELKVALSSTLKERRPDTGPSQGALATKLGRGMRTRLVLACLAVLAGCRSVGAPVPDPVPVPLPPDAFAIVAEADRLAARELWPGFDPRTVPVAIHDGEQTLLFRHPSPPAGFEPDPQPRRRPRVSRTVPVRAGELHRADRRRRHGHADTPDRGRLPRAARGHPHPRSRSTRASARTTPAGAPTRRSWPRIP
jgi:hypothetical protein